MDAALCDAAHDYALAVVEGREPACGHVRIVCQRHLDDLAASSDTSFPWLYDVAAADRVCKFAGRMRLNEGQFAGAPLVLLPWQHFWIRLLFGWRHREPVGAVRPRRYRRCLVETAKGSGKKSITATLALYLAFFDGEQGASVFVTAETFDQAGIVMSEVCGFVQRSSGLSNIVRIVGGLDRPMMVSAFDQRGKILRYTLGNKAPSGEIPSAIFADEAHEHTSDEAQQFLEAGVKSRLQPMTVITTNAGHGNTMPYYRERQRAEAVVNGTDPDPTYLALLYAVDPGDDPLADETVWHKANPSLPVVPGLPYIRSEVAKARISASSKVRVLRLNFGVWSEGVEVWMDPSAWRESEVDALGPDREGVDCVIALDLSLRRDLTSAGIVWDFGDRLEAETVSWTPADDLYGRQERERQPYLEWVTAGHLLTVPGAYIEYSYMVEWLIGMLSRWNVACLAYDPHGIDDFRKRLGDAGVEHTMDQRFAAGKLLMVPHPQGFFRGRKPAESEVDQAIRDSEIRPTMPNSIDGLEGEILQRRLQVLANPVLRAAVNGAYLADDGSANRRLMKNKSLCKIDPLMALTMAVGTALARRATLGGEGYFSDAEFYALLYGGQE